MNETTNTTSVLDRLKAGVLRFQTESYSKDAASYEYAATHPQKPHTLFITCSDSRINVEKLTSAGVGEVFITRNIGNVVPSYSKPLEAVSAVVEYAVTALKVSHVVVCGHSDCGAMKAVLNPPSPEALPAVCSWLTNACEAAPQKPEGESARLRETTEQNVLRQLENLKTHPAVADGLANGTLTISGWVYDIGSGQVLVAVDGSKKFAPVTAKETVTA